MKRILWLLYLTICICAGLQGQENSQHVFSSTGGGDNDISYTIGEPVISSVATQDSTIQLTQGFQQLQTLVITGVTQIKAGINFTVSPNPVQNQLKIQIAKAESNDIGLKIISSDGKLLEMPTSTEKDGAEMYVIFISFEGAPAGLYNIVLFDKKTNSRLGECKIVKIDI
jgi:hypothetical protein